MNTHRKHTDGSCDVDEGEADRGMDSRKRNQGCVDPGQLTAVGHSMHKCLRDGQHCALTLGRHDLHNSSGGRLNNETVRQHL